MHQHGVNLLEVANSVAAESFAAAGPQPEEITSPPPASFSNATTEVARLLELFVTYDGLVPAREFANDVWNVHDLCERRMIVRSPNVHDCGGYLVGEELRKLVQHV